MCVLKGYFIMCVFILIEVLRLPLDNFNVYAFVYSSSPKSNYQLDIKSFYKFTSSIMTNESDKNRNYT